MDIFNNSKIAELEATLRIYEERNKQLEQYKKKSKDLELKVKCMKMYIDDDDALIEIFEAAKKHDRQISEDQRYRNRQAMNSAQGQSGYFTGGGGLGGMIGGRG